MMEEHPLSCVDAFSLNMVCCESRNARPKCKREQSHKKRRKTTKECRYRQNVKTIEDRPVERCILKSREHVDNRLGQVVWETPVINAEISQNDGDEVSETLSSDFLSSPSGTKRRRNDCNEFVEEQRLVKNRANCDRNLVEFDRRSEKKGSVAHSAETNHIFVNSGECIKASSQSSAHRSLERHSSFCTLGLDSRLVNAISKRNITGNGPLSQPTLIQRNSIVTLLAQATSSDVFCLQSETGSGKTLAFLIPIVHSIIGDLANERSKHMQRTHDVGRRNAGVRCIVVCPTRELAIQTASLASNLVQHSCSHIVAGCVSGGEKRKTEKAKLRRCVTVLVATPGRLLDHLTKTECFLASIREAKLRWVVLDEADRLLDMGLKKQISVIVQKLRTLTSFRFNSEDSNLSTNKWTTVLVSATTRADISNLSLEILKGKLRLITASACGIFPESGNAEHCQNDQSASGGVFIGRSCVKDVADPNASRCVDECLKSAKSLQNSTPRQLTQLFMIVSAKHRLPALVAFLLARVMEGKTMLVFLSTRDGVEFHYALFTEMFSIISDAPRQVMKNRRAASMFGSSCQFYRLHGDLSHSERKHIFEQLSSSQINSNGRRKVKASVIFATDVAARGLNLAGVDWILQYDPPSEISDYVHRIGRTARAGSGGHAVVFLLPSEKEYVEVLKCHGLSSLSPCSLISAAVSAADLCPRFVKYYSLQTHLSTGEAFLAFLQMLFENFVQKSGVTASTTKRNCVHTKSGIACIATSGRSLDLLGLARMAFTSFLRAYSTKEKVLRGIFSVKALHLGHVARSFALQEPPNVIKMKS